MNQTTIGFNWASYKNSGLHKIGGDFNRRVSGGPARLHGGSNAPATTAVCSLPGQTEREVTVGPKKSGATTLLPLQTVIYGDFDTVYSDGPDRDLSHNVGWLHTAETHSCCLQINVITVE